MTASGRHYWGVCDCLAANSGEYSIGRSLSSIFKMAARIASIVESLANAENPVELLEDLKTLLATLPVLSLAQVVPNLSFNTVFDCLSTDNR